METSEGVVAVTKADEAEVDAYNNARYTRLSNCLIPLPVDDAARWPVSWPNRLTSIPPSLSSEVDAGNMFDKDTKHWSRIVSDIYMEAPINWSTVRNVMDMNAGYGGCDIIDVAVEIDRILRPDGYLLVQDSMEAIRKLGSILNTLHWSVTSYQNQFLVGRKSFWRPKP
ncbi:hypothetical protein TSUD_133620 [Trifolium subterraneum]|uniref:Methyltransferase n=1 Tax=Trifolium subterraneum TaxID=3900 RepID=A0A2Z6PII0_TRISU|nr:hypothetical protein TSUD_133620 [Trifolium subterraneum]